MPLESYNQSTPADNTIKMNDLLNSLRAEFGDRPIYPSSSDYSREDDLPEVEIMDAPEQDGDLRSVTDESTFRKAVLDLLKRAKDGEDIKLSVDAKATLKDGSGQPIKATQASILFEELKAAYPERAFTFSKPELNPGDKGYVEIYAPTVKQDGTHVSTKENLITLDKEITLADGTKVPSGSQFSVGTTYDGKQVTSADPGSKVWAVTPEGTYIQITEPGKAAQVSPDSITKDANKCGQVVDKLSKVVDKKTGQPFENRIIVRLAKDTAPDGKPLLDSYPARGETFDVNYKGGVKENHFATKAKAAPHLLLPENITIEAETTYGNSTASGKKADYFMQNGFADAKDATAKNYTGPTDSESAKELMRIRGELGMKEPIQAEASIQADAKTSEKNTEGSISKDQRSALDELHKVLKNQLGDTSVLNDIPDDRLKGMLEEVNKALPAEHRKAVEEMLKNFDKLKAELRTAASGGLKAAPPKEVATGSGIEYSAKGTLELEQASKQTVFNAEKALALRQSEDVSRTLKNCGMDEKLAKEIERKATSENQAEREQAVKDINDFFEKQIAAEESRSGATGKPGGEPMRGWERFKSKFSENKGRIATVVLVLGPALIKAIDGLKNQSNNSESKRNNVPFGK